MSKTASQICFDAADLIDEHGWTRGTLESPSGALCIHGALDKAAFASSYERAIAELAVCELTFPYCISEYNDEIAKDRRYITRKLRRAGVGAECRVAGGRRMNETTFSQDIKDGMLRQLATVW